MNQLRSVTELLSPWSHLLPVGVDWEGLVETRTARGTETWTDTDVLGDPVVVLSGVLGLSVDGPLTSLRRVRLGPGDVLGAGDLLAEVAERSAPELQGIRMVATPSEDCRILVFPQRRAMFEGDLGPLLEALRDASLATVERPALARLVARHDGLGALGAAARLALAASGRVEVLDREQRVSAALVGPHDLGVVISGRLIDDTGVSPPAGRHDRLPVDEGQRWAAVERCLVVVIAADDIAAARGAGVPEAHDAAYGLLHASALWRRVPADVDATAVFERRSVADGTVLAEVTPGGWTTGSQGAPLVFVLEGELSVRRARGAVALGRRTLRRGAFAGGSGWLSPELELIRAPELLDHGYRIEARGPAEVLVALAPSAPGGPVWAAVERLVREHLLRDAIREPVTEALARTGVFDDMAPSVLDQILDRGGLVRLARGMHLAPPADEFFVFLRGELVRHPGPEDARRLYSPVPMDVLGLTEFAEGWDPVGTWEAEGTCWMLRFRRSELEEIRQLARLIEARDVDGKVDFDKAGGAEIVLMHAPEFGVGVPAALMDLVAQAIAADFHDPILVVRLTPGKTSAGVELVEQSGTAPARVTLALPEDAPVAVLAPHLHAWNKRYAWIFLVPTGPEPGPLSRKLAPLVERLVLFTRDPMRPVELPVTVDTTVLVSVLVPETPWVERVLAESGGVDHPGFPDGAVRLRVGELVAGLELHRGAAPDLDGLDGPDQERIRRWARALTDRRVALALGGGGAYGFVHVAILQELHRWGIPVDMVSGSSFGAVVGAMYSAGGLNGLELLVAAGPVVSASMPLNYVSTRALEWAIELMVQAAVPLRGDAPLGIEWDRRAMSTDEAGEVLRRARKAVSRTLGRGLKAGRPLRVHLEDLEVPFFPVATDLDTGAEVVLEAGPVAQGVRASGSFPGIFSATPHPQDGRPLVDGGIAANVPDRVLAREGAALIVASNPVPPPQRAAYRRSVVDRLPVIRRLPQGVRSIYIMMHSMGQKDRRVVGATYNSPPVGHGITDVARGREIVAASYQQDEFRDAIHQARQCWRRLSRPRQVQAVATPTAREGRWSDVASTGYALIMPASIDRRSAVYKTLRPLLELRQAEATRQGAARYVELLGRQRGVRPGESAEAFLHRVGASPGRVDPDVLPFHLLLVGSPDELPLDFQVDLDADYAVGRIWFEELDELRRYVERVVRAEEESVRHRACLGLGSSGVGGPVERAIEEDLFTPLAARMTIPGSWTVERLQAGGGDGEAAALARALRMFQGPEAPDLLMYAGTTEAFPRDGRAEVDGVGRIRVGRSGRLGPDALDPAKPIGPAILVHYGSFTGGWEQESSFSFTDLVPRWNRPPGDHLCHDSQALLSWPAGGALAVVGKLDLSWFARTVRAESPEPQAFADLLEQLMEGRTVGAAMQSLADYFRLEATAMTSAAESGGEVEDEQTAAHRRVVALNARNWLLLGDPAVQLRSR